ncbi:type IV pilin protein [Lysobacter sp. HA35]
MRPSTSRVSRGFTLIELMIVVVVIAILAAIAYPSYSQYTRKAKRNQAKADLVEYAALAERFHTINNSYASFTLPNTSSPRQGGNPAYTLALNPTPTQSGFTITATPTTNQVKDKCGTLSINQAGVKSPNTGTQADCW